MFRRRPIARPLRRALPADVPPALRRANALMAAGQYAAAAEIFGQFGQAALQRGGPRAPIFLLQAGRAHLLAGQIQQSLIQTKKGLSALAERGQVAEAQRAGQRAAAALRERGLEAEAAELETFLGSLLPAGTVPLAEAPADPQAQRLLPTQCPSCGAPIRSDEVEWIDPATAECPFCGAAVRAER
jgi:hypothetical protein